YAQDATAGIRRHLAAELNDVAVVPVSRQRHSTPLSRQYFILYATPADGALGVAPPGHEPELPVAAAACINDGVVQFERAAEIDCCLRRYKLPARRDGELHSIRQAIGFQVGELRPRRIILDAIIERGRRVGTGLQRNELIDVLLRMIVGD